MALECRCGALDFLRETLRFFAEIPGAPDKDDDDDGERDKFPEEVLFADVAPGGDGVLGDDAVTEVLDDLGDGV